MGIAEGRVGDEEALLFERPFGKLFRSEFEEKLAGSWRRSFLAIPSGEWSGMEWGGGFVAFGVGVAVDDDVANEAEEFGCAVALLLELKELG